MSDLDPVTPFLVLPNLPGSSTLWVDYGTRLSYRDAESGVLVSRDFWTSQEFSKSHGSEALHHFKHLKFKVDWHIFEPIVRLIPAPTKP